MLRGDDEQAYRVPAIPLTGVLSDARVLIFLAVWFGINILFGLGSLPITGSDQPVAWQAHIGGFLAGLLLFSWFDPAPGMYRNMTTLVQRGISQAACAMCSARARLSFDGTIAPAGSFSLARNRGSPRSRASGRLP